MFEKGKQFLAELAAWIKAGRPVRSKNEVAELFEKCSSNKCGYYSRGNNIEGSCKSCGCRLSARISKLKPNKLHWATTSCPEGHWESEIEPMKITPLDIEIAEMEAEGLEKKKSGGGCGCGKK